MGVFETKQRFTTFELGRRGCGVSLPATNAGSWTMGLPTINPDTRWLCWSERTDNCARVARLPYRRTPPLWWSVRSA